MHQQEGIMRTGFLKGVVLGAIVSTLTLAASVALAGSGIGGVFNLGQPNTVNKTTTLTGTRPESRSCRSRTRAPRRARTESRST
jgi:hypothetical protein